MATGRGSMRTLRAGLDSELGTKNGLQTSGGCDSRKVRLGEAPGQTSGKYSGKAHD